MAYGASTMDTASVGAGTSTPGTALSAKGDALVEGFVSGAYFTSTSSVTSWLMGQVGIGTNTPGAQLAVDGIGLFNGMVIADSLVATSTSATSTLKWSLDVASSSLQVSGISGQVVIGATTTIPNSDVGAVQQSVDPALTITGTGSAAGATGTLYVAGGGASGGQIILKSSDGIHCLSLIATLGATALDASASTPLGLTQKTIPCPR